MIIMAMNPDETNGKKRPATTTSSSVDTSDDERCNGSEYTGADYTDKRRQGLDYDTLRREKRLAMNRATARERRRRKKERMELLEQRVQDLTQKNSIIQESNEVLRARVAQLEAQLKMANSTAEGSQVSTNNSQASLSHTEPSAQGFVDASRQDWRASARLSNTSNGGAGGGPLIGGLLGRLQQHSATNASNICQAWLANSQAKSSRSDAPSPTHLPSPGLSQPWRSSSAGLDSSFSTGLLSATAGMSQQQDAAARIRYIQMLQARIDEGSKALLGSNQRSSEESLRGRGEGKKDPYGGGP